MNWKTVFLFVCEYYTGVISVWVFYIFWSSVYEQTLMFHISFLWRSSVSAPEMCLCAGLRRLYVAALSAGGTHRLCQRYSVGDIAAVCIVLPTCLLFLSSKGFYFLFFSSVSAYGLTPSCWLFFLFWLYLTALNCCSVQDVSYLMVCVKFKK